MIWWQLVMNNDKTKVFVYAKTFGEALETAGAKGIDLKKIRCCEKYPWEVIVVQ